MPDLTPDEADRCPYCGRIVTDPPNCCDELREEYAEETDRLRRADHDEDLWDDWQDEGMGG